LNGKVGQVRITEFEVPDNLAVFLFIFGRGYWMRVYDITPEVWGLIRFRPGSVRGPVDVVENPDGIHLIHSNGQGLLQFKIQPKKKGYPFAPPGVGYRYERRDIHSLMRRSRGRHGMFMYLCVCSEMFHWGCRLTYSTIN